MDTTTLGASPAPPSSPSSTTSYSFPGLKKIWEKKLRDESAKKAAGSAATSAYEPVIDTQFEYSGDSRLPEKFRREPGIPRMVELGVILRYQKNNGEGGLPSWWNLFLVDFFRHNYYHAVTFLIQIFFRLFVFNVVTTSRPQACRYVLDPDFFRLFFSFKMAGISRRPCFLDFSTFFSCVRLQQFIIASVCCCWWWMDGWIVAGAKRKWRDEREAAKASPPTTSSTSPESRPVATPASRQKPGQGLNENDPMDWEDEEWDMMDTRDDYPWLGMVGSCQAAWVYEKIIFPSMIAAGIPRDPYAYPFVR
ncbi:uncharacterized protein K444DRAFT_628364 [Hyaloscypha bicolor E]|uniref:Uncharacterized protein n=1 Tax=Hyaloscypha bicolor E TaxID=1095630 RepID=A0A2J6TE74_9HELO|nr:uncharacterized protein K444DRAFT_628364 [Hyaloscypha bicolor E]PMD61303.1 hypothetical protein K444DRAFT_628364 [Hyaloscypha bicolor E]